MTPHRSLRARAFTLVEMLAVIAVIIVLAGLLAPAASTILRGNQLTQASDMMVAGLTLARQTAISNNCPVEIRFYQYGDPSYPGEQANAASSGKYRAFQMFRIDDSGTATAAGKVIQLPTSILIDADSTTFSTLLGSPQSNPATGLSIPRAGVYYNYCSFRFRPDGSTNLSPTAPPLYWSLTLHNLVDKNTPDPVTGPQPPSNYATIQVDPVSGTVTSYRP